MRRSIFLLLSLFLISDLAAKSANSREALQQVNAIRAAAQLPLYSHSDLLQRSAKSHASYIAINMRRQSKGLDLHKQNPKKAGFSGVNATARSAKTSYPSRDVKENISFGKQQLSKSLSGLMSAIYHRFTFLDFLSDTLGYGTAKSKEDIHNHVFNMGRKDMESTCRVRPESARPIVPVDCLGTSVKPDYIDNVCKNLPAEAFYEDPFKSRCPNGRLLKASFMNDVCRNPPADILFRGSGSYYSICQPQIRVETGWFDEICNSSRNNPHPALHSGEIRFYQMCESDARVNVSWYKNFCDSATPNDVVLDASYYRDLCNVNSNKTDFDVSSTYRQQLDSSLYRKSPDFVIWPPHNAKQVSPVFYDEMPDPLPDYDVSGYPLSLQFNPGKLKSVQVSDFRLEKQNNNGSWSPVKAVREMNRANDPNKSFTKLEFAWFPLKRLDWNTRYRASVSVLTNAAKTEGKRKNISWAFKTETIKTPLIIVNSQQNQANVPSGKWFTLYHLPSKKVSRPMQQISAQWRQPARVESEIIDLNTIRMKFENNRCESVVLSMAQRGDLTLNTCSGS